MLILRFACSFAGLSKSAVYFHVTAHLQRFELSRQRKLFFFVAPHSSRHHVISSLKLRIETTLQHDHQYA